MIGFLLEAGASTPNPTINNIVLVLGGALLTLVGNIVLKKIDKTKDVEIAQIKSKEEELRLVKEDLLKLEDLVKSLEEAIKELKVKNSSLEGYVVEKDSVIKELESIIKRFKALFDITYKHLKTVLNGDEYNLVVLEEVKKTFDEHK